MKRLVFAVFVVSALALWAGSALAAAPNVEQISAGFTLSSLT